MSIEAVTIYTDGGSRGNPGPAAAGFWVPSLQQGSSRFLGCRTNNEAEYEGLILALDFAADNEITAVRIKADSKLIVNQVSGAWSIKFPHLQKLCDQVTERTALLSSFNIEYVPRAQNFEADRECNECMDEATNDATGFFN